MAEEDFFDDLEKEAETAPKAAAATLDAVRAMGVEAARLERDITQHETALKKLKTRRYDLLNKEMPSTMDDLKVPSLTVEGYKMDCGSYYKANIAADDPPEKREAAFEWVDEAGGGDIISNTVTVAFPREMSEEAKEFAEEIANRFHNHPSIEVVRERKVPWNRLTSWLRDYVETPPVRGKSKLSVPLDLLNATIGRVVKIKEVSD